MSSEWYTVYDKIQEVDVSTNSMSIKITLRCICGFLCRRLLIPPHSVHSTRLSDNKDSLLTLGTMDLSFGVNFPLVYE